ncbi:MAG: MarR family transcriptional regulator [Bacteroidetes bacterium]|nr:MarR family transcriptional regulator [Bacteroidota bacterium]
MRTTTKYGKEADRALGMWVKLARASATFNKATVRDIRRYGLTQPQFAVVECLGHLGGMPIGKLSRKMLVSGGNMTCVVDNLEKEGLVQRHHSESDRRSVIVDLTDRGRALFAEIFPQHAEYIVRLASVLTSDEQEELSRLLRKLGTGIDA